MSRTKTSDALGVWDDSPSVAVTDELSTAAMSLWTASLPEEVSAAATASLARLVVRAGNGRQDALVAELLAVYGHGDPGDSERLATRDPVAAAIATGISTVGVPRPTGMAPGIVAQLVTFAALDPVARLADTDSRLVVRAYSVAFSLAGPLQRVFDGLGVEPHRTCTTVGSIVGGIGALLLREDPDEHALASTVGLLASCSLATGSCLDGEDAWALVIGKAAGNALLAVSLVERGFTANLRALEGARGLLSALSGTLPAEGDTRELREPRFAAPDLESDGPAGSLTEPPPPSGMVRSIDEGTPWSTIHHLATEAST